MQNIIIAFAKSEDTETFKKLLGRKGIPVSKVCNAGAQALFAMEELESGILICGYKLTDMRCLELAESLPPHFSMLLVVSPGRVPYPCPENVTCLPTPLKAGDFFGTLDMLLDRISSPRRKKPGVMRRRSPEEEKLLSDAKAVLMERHRMTESDAHRYLQKRSMETGRSIAETAEMVLMLNV